MSKKVVIINGSYHKDGMIVSLIDGFKSGLTKSSTDVEIRQIDLVSLKMDFCLGCWECTKKPGDLGECVIDDGVKDILPLLQDADVLVYATPVYMFGPTAIMKKFMERNLPVIGPVGMLKGRNKRRRDKVGVILLSSGAPYPINVLWGVTRYPAMILSWICKLWSCGTIFSIRAGGMEGSDKTKDKFVRKSADLGEKVGKMKF